jgi:predicted ferric reductase
VIGFDDFFGWLGLVAILVSSMLFIVNRVASGLSMRYMRVHCYTGFLSVVFTLLHNSYHLESITGNWNSLTNLGLVLIITGSGMLLKHLPDAGSYRFHSATIHPALVLALLVSMFFHILG